MFRAFIIFVKQACQRMIPRGSRSTLTEPTAPSEDEFTFDLSAMVAKDQRERRCLREIPPPCGSVIRYIQEGVYGKTYGEFLFRTTDVEQELKNTLRENPHLANDDEGAILNWAKRRDESLTEPTDVPSTWSRFQYVADNLVRAGKAEIYCKDCKAVIGSDQIVTNDDTGKRGWNFDRVVCPHGHNLLAVDSVHLMIN